MNSDIEKIRSLLTDLREEISELLKIKEKVFRIYFHDSMNEAWPGVKEALSNLSESLFQEDNFRSEDLQRLSLT